MKTVCFYFQIHQPYRVKRYRIFDVGRDADYFNDRRDALRNNRLIVERLARESYIPTTRIVLDLLEQHPELRVSYSFSGLALEQLERYAPEVIDLLRRVISTGQAEVLGETYYHSLAFFYSRPEFERQVTHHRDTIRRLFGVWPRVFRNTELAYRNDLGEWAEGAGYAGVVTGGWDAVLGWRSPNYLYQVKNGKRTRLLMKNDRLSEHLLRGIRRDERGEEAFSPSYAHQVLAEDPGETVNFFMDYELFRGYAERERHKTSILESLLIELLSDGSIVFRTPSEVIATHDPKDEIDVPYILTWSDGGKDLDTWAGNPMQKAAIENVYALEPMALEANDAKLLDDWRRLQTSDHFEFMNTTSRHTSLPEASTDGGLRHPYETPYDAYISYMNALSDLRLRLNAHTA